VMRVQLKGPPSMMQRRLIQNCASIFCHVRAIFTSISASILREIV
jgi:hypothetical protein